MTQIEKFLKSDGFRFDTRVQVWDKDNTRVYFDDIDIIVVRFNNPKNRVIQWKNRIDGNMSLDQKTSLIFTMVRI